MIERKGDQPTPQGSDTVDERSGTDRRRTHTMLNPDVEKRKGDRRKNSFKKGTKDR